MELEIGLGGWEDTPSCEILVTTIPRSKELGRDFPGGPVVKALPPSAGGVGLTPGWGIKIPHGLWPPKNQNIKQNQYSNKFSKDFKNGPH